SARHLPLPQVSDRALERLRPQAQCPVRARRNARQARCSEAGRAHLYPVESEVAQAAEANAVVPRLLQHQQALAQSQPQTSQRCAREDGDLTSRPTRHSPLPLTSYFLFSASDRNFQKYILRAQRRAIAAR